MNILFKTLLLAGVLIAAQSAHSITQDEYTESTKFCLKIATHSPDLEDGTPDAKRFFTCAFRHIPRLKTYFKDTETGENKTEESDFKKALDGYKPVREAVIEKLQSSIKYLTTTIYKDAYTLESEIVGRPKMHLDRIIGFLAESLEALREMDRYDFDLL